jgi:HlyD family secretion protein
MRRFFLLLAIIIVVIAGVLGAVELNRHRSPEQGNSRPYRTATVRQADIAQIVTSNGTVQPVLSVQVGSFVSGPILKVLVDFNARVKAGQLLAQIDPRLYKATLAHQEASLAHAHADLARVKALLGQAKREEGRAVALKPKKAIADTDFDQAIANSQSLEAQARLAEASIQECEADLAMAKTNVEFTDIKSPVDGIVIDRKVDPGQTVASQFQTPVLFVVAPDLEKKVNVYASVDEADIGLIQEAQKRSQPVTFTVDAHPRDVFHGKIAQVRLNPTTVQNVVTYTVVVEAPNTEIKLLPGMTANLSFQIEKHVGRLVLPNGALRFRPKAEQVRPRDQALLENAAGDDPSRQDATDASKAAVTTAGDATNAVNGQPRFVWICEGDMLSAVPITTGLSDKEVVEIVSGNLAAGQEVVVGVNSPATK